MATLYKDLKLSGVDEELFLKKISMIHITTSNIRIKQSDREAK